MKQYPSGYSWPTPTAEHLGVAPHPMGSQRAFPGADRYLFVLGLALTGYAVMGRGFAYIGLPPLFIGEMLLAIGGLLWITGRSVRQSLSLVPMSLLMVMIVWVTIRMVPYIGAYGVDAPRDAMIAGYGLFAFIVAGFVLERPDRLHTLLRRYKTFVLIVISLGWSVYLLYRQMPDVFPKWPWAEIRMVENKPGDLLVHLAGATAFLVLGFRRSTPWVITLLLVGVAVGVIGTRGGMIAYVLSLAVFAVMKPPPAKFGRLIYAIVLFAVLGLIVDTSSLKTSDGSRALSTEQIVDNVLSIFGRSDSFELNTTAEWRMEWWTKITDYTVFGQYFWTGKGFGVNLAKDDGFSVSDDHALRSPHNGHLTMLARGGVPGLLLWLAVHISWLVYVLGAWLDARRMRRYTWMGVFAFIMVYWTAGMINAAFDVYLEGPMGAIWFWTFFGLGMACARLYRERPTFWDDHDKKDAAPIQPLRTHAWSWGANPEVSTTVGA